MFRCCIIFQKNKRKDSDAISIKNIPTQHYSDQISEESQESSLSAPTDLNPKPDNEIENSTDSSSEPLSNDIPQDSYSICPLLFPSRDDLGPSSDLVASESSNFDILLNLESEPDWEVKLEQLNAYVMIKPSNEVQKEVPIMKAFFDLEMEVDPELVYNIIYEPEIRKQWDKSIEIYTEIEKIREDVIQYYMHNKAPWPFADRDFVETRYIRRRANGDLEIYFTRSENEQFPDKGNKVVRGETIIGGQIYRKRISPSTGKMSLMITSVFQADLKGEIPKKLLKITLPSSVLKWFKSVKRQVQIMVGSD